LLVLGSSGLFGSTLNPILEDSGHTIIKHSNSSYSSDVLADLTDEKNTYELINSVKPDVIINLVCLSDVDECERDIKKAYRLNVTTAKNISQAVTQSDRSIRLIHFSTDQIYNKKKANNEDDVSLINNYAITKFQSEQEVSKANAMIIRTNFFGRSKHASKISFSDWVTDSIDKNEVKFISDVFFSPVTMTTLSELLLMIISKGLNSGTYNIGSKNGMSKFEFAQTLANLNGRNIEDSRSILLSQLDLDAKRPKCMIMNSAKFESDFDHELPTLDEEIRKVI